MMKTKIHLKTYPKLLTLVFLIFSTTSAYAENLRILAYGDSNTWGWNPVAEGFPAGRHSDETRWAGILEDRLQGILTDHSVEVIVDGMVGRTTDINSATAVGAISGNDFNGKTSLPASIARNSPIDLVVIMLGTNDMQAGRERPAELVAKAAFDLADLARSVDKPTFSFYKAPKALVITPPALGDTSLTPLSGLFAAGEEPSKSLSTAFKAEASKRNEDVFIAGDVITTDGIDGIHLTENSHQILGKALSEKIAEDFAASLNN
ncbi:GDSL-type esterase/lipase family protein [Curvivirga sp.]|uniref:GDSL-type esterase/lipase family protein n=1 Tax=Curvivirga sp. TaxID=2856848 RepID=UPI003B5C9628